MAGRCDRMVFKRLDTAHEQGCFFDSRHLYPLTQTASIIQHKGRKHPSVNGVQTG